MTVQDSARAPARADARGGEAAISVSGLVKSFGAVRALDGVDLEAAQGTVLGLLGPNGAGKTTAVRILATLLEPDAGSAQVAGFDVVRQATALRSRIGLAGQNAAVDENLTGFENLEMVGRLYHLGKRPRCSSSTSRSRGWTRAAAAPSGTPSRTASPVAPPCCSPPSTSRRPTAWPTGSPCS